MLSAELQRKSFLSARSDRPKERRKSALNQGGAVQLRVSEPAELARRPSQNLAAVVPPSRRASRRTGLEVDENAHELHSFGAADAERLMSRMDILKVKAADKTVGISPDPSASPLKPLSLDAETDELAPTDGFEVRDFAITLLQLLNDRLDQIRTEFTAQRRGLCPDAFVEVMSKSIQQAEGTLKASRMPSYWEPLDSMLTRPPGHGERAACMRRLDRRLRVLFRAIDCSQDGYCSWDEVSEYLIAATMQGRQGQDNMIKEYTLQRRYNLSGVASYRGCQYASGLGRILAYGRELSVIEVPRDDQGGLDTFSLPIPDNTCVNHAEFLSGHHVIAAALTDMTLRFYEAHRTGRELKRHALALDETLLVCRHHRRSGVLFTGSRSGSLIGYTTRQGFRPDGSEITVALRAQPHDQGITEIVVMPLDSSLATASLDGTISIVEPMGGRTLLKLSRTGGNAPGISRMSYVDAGDGARFLGTCGHENEARMWVVQNKPAAPFVLRDPDMPHLSNVSDVVGVFGAPQALTLDTLGVVKVWDVRTFRCVQTVRCESGLAAAQAARCRALCWLPKDHRLVALGQRKCYALSYGSAAGVEVVEAEANPIAALCYSYQSQTLITASAQSIRIWDAMHGRMTLTLAQLSQSAITAVTVSSDGRKLYIGTAGGGVRCLNASNGALVSELCAEPAAEVQGLLCLWGRQTLVAVRWDGACQAYDLTGGDRGEMSPLTVDTRCFPAIDAKCAAFSCQLNRLAVGDGKGFVSLWEARVRRNESCNVVHHTEAPDGGGEVTQLCFLDGAPALAGVDGNGAIHIWALPPHPSCFRVLVSWRPEELTDQEVLTCLGWYWPRAMLIAGTSDGRLLSFFLNDVLAHYGVTHCCTTLEGMMEQQSYTCGAGPVAAPQTYRCIRAHLHGSSVSGIAVDPVYKFIATSGADRQVVFWTCVRLTRLGTLDQTQRQMHSIPPLLCGLAADDADADDFFSFEPAVHPYPGHAWFGGSQCAPAENHRDWERGLRHAAMGRSVLGCDVPLRGESGAGHRQRVTQQAFRTPQCNESLARLREVALGQNAGETGLASPLTPLPKQADAVLQSLRPELKRTRVGIDSQPTSPALVSPATAATGTAGAAAQPGSSAAAQRFTKMLSRAAQGHTQLVPVQSSTAADKIGAVTGGSSPMYPTGMSPAGPLLLQHGHPGWGSTNAPDAPKSAKHLWLDAGKAATYGLLFRRKYLGAAPRGTQAVSPLVRSPKPGKDGAEGSPFETAEPPPDDEPLTSPMMRVQGSAERTNMLPVSISKQQPTPPLPAFAVTSGTPKQSALAPPPAGPNVPPGTVAAMLATATPWGRSRAAALALRHAGPAMGDICLDSAIGEHMLRRGLNAQGLCAVQSSSDSGLQGGSEWYSASALSDPTNGERRLNEQLRLARHRHIAQQMEEEAAARLAEEMERQQSEGEDSVHSPATPSPGGKGSSPSETPRSTADDHKRGMVVAPGREGSAPVEPSLRQVPARKLQKGRPKSAAGTVSAAPPLPPALLRSFGARWRDLPHWQRRPKEQEAQKRAAIPSARAASAARATSAARAASAATLRPRPASAAVGGYEEAARRAGQDKAVRILGRIIDAVEAGADAQVQAGPVKVPPAYPPRPGTAQPRSPPQSPTVHGHPPRRPVSCGPVRQTPLQWTAEDAVPAAWLRRPEARTETPPRARTSIPRARTGAQPANKPGVGRGRRWCGNWDAQTGRRITGGEIVSGSPGPAVAALQKAFCAAEAPQLLRDSGLLGVRCIAVSPGPLESQHSVLAELGTPRTRRLPPPPGAAVYW
eukprot:TRINITY_DN11944_c0_g1_i1.p1 TRINITY_DN11944_c0_g1~~TRINITY_DN11944_c0_g1_i1.p1  ORF type:complete len:1833 (+),score=160.66 TRINITY_DN11944_c0_g1_i1:106-5499(+)